MNDVTDNRTLVLGATGKTGSRVAQNLLNQGIAIRTAARSGADVRFDWNDPSTFASALLKVSRVYLVSPVMRVDFADIVAKFLDEAERAGVRHVTYLSAYGMEHAPAEVALRAVELDLASRPLLSHSIVRPAWFMQNFSETFVKPANDEIVVPGAMGAEAFVNAEDIASVAAATLSDPERHAGRAYSPTGPEALTFEDVAAHISNAVGRKISYCDIDRNTWIDAMIQAGVPAEYGEVLRLLTETIASGRGSRPNNDVLTVTGKAPISFAEFAAKTSAAWRQ
ncbi:NmrA family NAD(P)-binding protein [Dickeya sp. ws52]|uniref:NmrA family NAD(P)-binding protein n=1 Tax=Dickeya sp. ws52 TaxID=2576377 RepID=UPI00117BEF08|nr:NmrA family NAD(P)-binding protein [Dickeya sp. ws52]TYL43661.1 NAD(P)H-binding protein [Dickeya sp. ws52]